MKFFLCKDKSKFTKQQTIESYGEWYFIRDNKVKMWVGPDHIVLYCGYLIEGDMQEVCENFSFKEANGNFFAVKLVSSGLSLATEDSYELALDYFQNHKLFVSDKYGVEITNYLPYMTIKKEDIIRKSVQADKWEREHSDEECTTYYDHIHIWNPKYDYIQDAKDAFAQEIYTDVDILCNLTTYIQNCMKEHSDIIKEKYPVRYCSLSEGIDSALQGVFFHDDLQMLYDVNPCDSGTQHKKFIKITQDNFPNTHHYTYNIKDNKKECLEHLVDSSCRRQDMIPSFKQLKMQDQMPDIFMYGVNGNEMFVRDFIPHMLVLSLKYYDRYTPNMREKLRLDISSKHSMYGSAYSLPQEDDKHSALHSGSGFEAVTGFTALVNKFMNVWFGYGNSGHYLNPKTIKKSYEDFEDALAKLSTPKLYTRVITSNMDIMSGSLYNDKRIFHEFMKVQNKVLETIAMDAPIQKAILDKYNYNFVTPRNDIVGANYELLYKSSYEATIDHDLEQNI